MGYPHQVKSYKFWAVTVSQLQPHQYLLKCFLVTYLHIIKNELVAVGVVGTC